MPVLPQLNFAPVLRDVLRLSALQIAQLQAQGVLE